VRSDKYSRHAPRKQKQKDFPVVEVLYEVERSCIGFHRGGEEQSGANGNCGVQIQKDYEKGRGYYARAYARKSDQQGH